MTHKNHDYAWQGLNQQQQPVSGLIKAPHKQQAKLMLLANDITPNHLQRVKQPRQGKKLSTQSLTQFLQQLATLLQSSMPLLNALRLCQKTQTHPALPTLLQQLQDLIQQGHSLSQACAQFPRYFDKLLISMLEIGEQTGTLPTLLQRLVQQRQQSAAAQQKIKKALYYPVTVVSVAVIITLAMLLFVIPQFEQVFISFGAELPMLTQLTLQIGHGLTQHGLYILSLLSSLLLLSYFSYRYHEPSRGFAHGLILKLPLIGKLLTLSYQSHYCYLLSLTTQSGLAMPQALRLIANHLNNLRYHRAVIKIQQDITAGHALHQAMADSHQFSAMACDMVAVGEESGELIAMLQHVATLYQQQMHHIIDNLGNLLEPCMMILIGLIIGGLVVTMYLPIFNMGNVIT